ncbi:hypothetical protein PVAP13_1NG149100 [Panicum virgatum]|uniref:Meg domain-containing protein n=1 Tax=Panicum virgatum TaxID=38727 RepID=A0A8T0WWY8_PANVG|nr:hypothetical protein PVAP13_1NG149100 [Panicum virgatum]
MERRTMRNDAIVLLFSLLLLGCFSIHAECRSVLDEMGRKIAKKDTCYKVVAICPGRYHDLCFCCTGATSDCFVSQAACQANCH